MVALWSRLAFGGQLPGLDEPAPSLLPALPGTTAAAGMLAARARDQTTAVPTEPAGSRGIVYLDSDTAGDLDVRSPPSPAS
jgi:hypothetical protein